MVDPGIGSLEPFGGTYNRAGWLKRRARRGLLVVFAEETTLLSTLCPSVFPLTHPSSGAGCSLYYKHLSAAVLPCCRLGKDNVLRDLQAFSVIVHPKKLTELLKLLAKSLSSGVVFPTLAELAHALRLVARKVTDKAVLEIAKTDLYHLQSITVLPVTDAYHWITALSHGHLVDAGGWLVPLAVLSWIAQPWYVITAREDRAGAFTSILNKVASCLHDAVPDSVAASPPKFLGMLQEHIRSIDFAGQLISYPEALGACLQQWRFLVYYSNPKPPLGTAAVLRGSALTVLPFYQNLRRIILPTDTSAQAYEALSLLRSVVSPESGSGDI